MTRRAAKKIVRDWLAGRPDLVSLMQKGDIKLHVYRDGDHDFAFHFSADEEAPADVRSEFEQSSTSYVHASGWVEAYV